MLDLMCGGRLEVGIGPGGNLSAYKAFGLDSAERTALLVRHHRVLLDAWAGRPLPGGDRLYPPNPGLADRVWQATFNVEGARRAGAAGDGLMLSRTQPRPAGGAPPVAARHPEPDDRRLSGGAAAGPRAAHPGLAHRVRRRRPRRGAAAGRNRPGAAAGTLRRDRPRGVCRGHVGARPDRRDGYPYRQPGRRDRLAARRHRAGPRHRPDRAVHSIDPPHPFILRSIELVADVVAPALGWVRSDGAAARHVA